MPMLFLFGSDDASVPAQESAAKIGTTLDAAGSRHFAVEVLANANHLLMTPSQRAPGLMDRMATFMLRH